MSVPICIRLFILVVIIHIIHGEPFGSSDGTIAGSVVDEQSDEIVSPSGTIQVLQPNNMYVGQLADERVVSELNLLRQEIQHCKSLSTADPGHSSVTIPSKPLDCSDVNRDGTKRSGRYSIYPEIGVQATEGSAVDVWCDLETTNGGWTVIQRREDGSVDFKRTWNDYKRGFGYVGGEFWIGNENLHHITHQKSYELRVEVEYSNGLEIVTSVNHIRVGDEKSKYELYVGSSDSEGVCDIKSTLGMEDERIQAHQIIVSSINPGCNLRKCDGDSARLNLIQTSTHEGAWIARVKDRHQWVQVYLDGWRLITGVVTQGRSDHDHWVTEYKVQYGADGSSWNNVTNVDGQEIVFTGNSVRNTPVTNKFDSPVRAKFVRIVPLEWHVYISLRFELLGCNAYAWSNLKYQPFSTDDVDNDGNNHSHCAAHGGAWWYGDTCALTGFNGDNLKGINSENVGIKWEHEGVVNYVRRTELKIRPKN